MRKILEAHQDFKREGKLFGYSNSVLLFLWAYFVDRIYRE